VAIRTSPSPGWMKFYWFGLVLVWTLYGLQTVMCYLEGYRDPYPETRFIVPLMLSGVIVGYKWAFRKMAEFDDDVQQMLRTSDQGTGKPNETDDWYRQEFRAIFDWKKSVTASVVFTAAALIIARKMGVAAWFPTRLSQFFGFLPYALIGTAFGACVWPGYRMSAFVHSLAKHSQQINPFMPSNIGIFNIARTFIKFEAVGILLILLFGTAFEVSPYRVSNGFILVSAMTVSLVWALWFYYTQSQIHNAMVKYKHELQKQFAERYEKHLLLLLKQPDQRAFERLERLIVLKKEIESIPVWPFNTRGLITSLGLVATPVLAVLVQRLLGK